MINSGDFVFNNHCLVTLSKNLNWSNKCQKRPKIFQGSLMDRFIFNNQGVNELHCSQSRHLPGRDCNPVTRLSLLTLILRGSCEPHSSKVLHFFSCFLLSVFLVRNFINYFLIVEFCFLFEFNILCTIVHGICIKCVYMFMCLFSPCRDIVVSVSVQI